MTDRSPEERERARVEREARRTGKPPPAQAPSAPPPSAQPPFTPEPQPRPEPAPSPPAAPQSAPPSRPLVTPVSAARGPQGLDRARSALAARRAARDPGDGGGGLVRLIPFALLGAALAGVIVLLVLIYQPGASTGGRSVTVEIPENSGIGEIAGLLADQGVIAGPVFFQVRATLDGRRDEVRPGEFELAQGMSYDAALDILTAPPRPAVEQQAKSAPIEITIPEGQSREEIAELVADAGLEGDYVKATERSKDLDSARYGAKGADSLEGFLWPATYKLERGDSVEKLVKQQLQAFEDNIASVDLKDAKKKLNLTPFDVLTTASMVEREATLDKERPIIAGVIYNRLRDGIPLGIDATIRFATGNWTEPLTESELAIESPYNTRTNQGLPPGPIGNPGLASLEAAAKPDKTKFLFYVVKPDGCGEHAFSEDNAQFEQDVKRYNTARDAAGGKAPSDC